jgi:lipopolysaccharide export system permease protein
MGKSPVCFVEENPMTVLSRYITATYLKLLALTAGSFVAIYLVIDFLEKISRFSQASGNPQYILFFYLYKIPAIINQVMPLAILMSTLLTLGILSRSSEIVAMQSCGISLKRIAMPLLYLFLQRSHHSKHLTKIEIYSRGSD